MTKQELFRKLTSRKLWAALAGLSAGLAMAFGLDEAVISTVAGAVVAVASVATYIVTEGGWMPRASKRPWRASRRP